MKDDIRWPYFAGFYLASAGIVFLMTSSFMQNANTNKFWKALRLCYPMFMFIFFYEAVGPQVFMVFGRSFDSQIHSIEMAIFGVDPAFALQPYMEIWLNEVMSLAYLSYYLILPVSVLYLVVKKEWETLERLTLTVGLTFYFCYLIFIFFPIAGPRFYLNNIYYLPLWGPYFTDIATWVVHRGGLFGGAMPSSHCAVALVVVLVLGKRFNGARYVLTFFLLMVCAGTIYGRYHYVSDVVAGIFVGSIANVLTNRWQNGFLVKMNDKRKNNISAESYSLPVTGDDYSHRNAFKAL